MTATKLITAYLKRKGITAADLARAADLSRGTLSNAINGKRAVGRIVGAAIEKATGGEVPASAWPVPKRRPRADRAA